MSERKTEQFWAIASEIGLYCGTWLTRAEAISAHTSAYRDFWKDVDNSRLRETTFGGLNDAQRTVWKRLKKRGDYAVKVDISYQPRSQE